MRGPDSAAKLVAGRLEARVPLKITELETRLGLTPGSIELPRLYASEERPQIELDLWPAIIVVPQGSELRAVEILNAGIAYAVTYRLRVYSFARGQEFAETSTARHRLALAVREVLLERPSLGDPGARIDPSLYRESYSDVDVDERDGRSIAGAFAEVSLIIEETMASIESIGHPGPLIPEATGLPPHPALD
jgi:hypothetical protein